jgi:hypothetical protein
MKSLSDISIALSLIPPDDGGMTPTMTEGSCPRSVFKREREIQTVVARNVIENMNQNYEILVDSDG